MNPGASGRNIPDMDESGNARPVFFCCGCAVVAAIAVAVAVYIAARHLPELALALTGGNLEDEPLDIPARTISEDEAARLKVKISAHLTAAAEGKAGDLVLDADEFELILASALSEGKTPEEVRNFDVTAEGDRLRVRFSYEIKEGKYLNIDFTGGARIASGKLSLDFARCTVGGKEIESEKLDKLAEALTEGIEKNPDVKEALSAFEKLETSGGKLHIRLRPEAAEKLLKRKEPAPAEVEI